MRRNIITLLLTTALLLSGGRSVGCPVKSNPLILQQTQRIAAVKSTAEGKRIFKLVDKYSAKYKVDKRLIHAIIMVESNYRPHLKGSCVGLMQINPYFAKKHGYNVYNVEQNIEYGTKHIAGLLAKYKGNERLALAAYNCGGGCVDSYHGKIPPRAIHYVNRVLLFKKLT